MKQGEVDEIGVEILVDENTVLKSLKRLPRLERREEVEHVLVVSDRIEKGGVDLLQ